MKISVVVLFKFAGSLMLLVAGFLVGRHRAKLKRKFTNKFIYSALLRRDGAWFHPTGKRFGVH
jgi:hypothetical protein